MARLETSVRRQEYLSTTTAVVAGIGLAGCTGLGDDLEIVDESYSYSEPEAYGTWTVTVENSGETTNVVATVDLVSTTGEDEGEVLESYDRTSIVEEGETETIRVRNAYYINYDEYEFSRDVEPTDRPHATYEVDYGEGPEILLDATGSGSVESFISSYEWSAREFEYVESGEQLNWDIPDRESLEFTPPDPDDYFANIVLTVTDEEGRSDTYHGESVSSGT